MICRNCGAGLEAHRIDTSLGVVTCSHCGSLHNVPADNTTVLPKSTNSVPAAKPERAEVTLPKRFSVKRTSGSMEVFWPVGRRLSGVVISIIAGAFVYAALTSGMLFLLVASAGLFYFAAIQAFNTHRIRVDGARLEVTQGPLPALGNRKFDASDIMQLYATQHVTRTETRQHNDRAVNVRKHYRLSAKTQSGGRVTVLNGLDDPLHALWLEQELERLLGIVDRQVAGEYRG